MRTAFLAILLALGACDPGLGPMSALPDNAVEFLPSAEYQDWWARTEVCSGGLRQPAGIAWFVVPEVSGFMTSDGEVLARWSRGTNGARIVVAGAYIGSELVVRHEMLHALLDRGDHPAEYFVDRCELTWGSWNG